MNYHEYRDAIFASDLTAPQKLLALAISYHYNWKNQEPAYPSNKTLARETGLAVSTIVKAKRTLIKRGFILSQQRFNNSSEYTCNIPYHLVCSQIEPNNEYNNELNNEYKITISEESISFNSSVDPLSNKQSKARPAALTQEKVDWLTSW
jgi:DNA-binding transcriptional MocR family regulator